MSPTIPTATTTKFDLAVPIISAPMAYATCPPLVAAVINAGGLGFLGAGAEPSPKLAAAVDEARSLVIDPAKKSLVSMGFVGWVLDMFNNDEKDPRLRTVLEKEVMGVWFAYGKDLGKYVKYVKDFDEGKSHKHFIVVTVNSVEEAKTAVNEWKPDVIVVQGAEAGGRGASYSPPTFEFLKSALSALGSSAPLVWAAGGVSTGSQLASLIAAGASGVVLGTRLLFTQECMWDANMKKAIVDAKSGQTERSKAYDLAFPPNVWPSGIEARCVVNQVEKEFLDGVPPPERSANLKSGKYEYQIVYAGTGVGDVDKIEPAANVVKQLHEETAKALGL